MTDELYTKAEVAKMLQITVRSVHNLIVKGHKTNGRDGLFPIIRIQPRTVRIPASTLETFLEKCTCRTV